MKYIFTFFLIILLTDCFGQTIIDQQTKDTLIFTEVTQSYKTTKLTRKPYKPPVIVQPPAASKYFLFPVSDPLVLSGQSNIIIENKRFENSPGVSLKITNCRNITVRNCLFNRSGEEAIVIEGSTGVLVEYNLFAFNTTGVYATTSQTVKVNNNQFVNMRMRADGSSRGQAVQFNTVTGAGNEVQNNRSENFPGESNPEDHISMFRSSGTALSPILIKNNYLRGGGPSTSGGGIIAGDYGGDYIRIENNFLVNPGNYGIAVTGGNNNVLNNNRVYSDFHTYNNAGAIIWAQGGVSCSNVTYTNNHINWPYKAGGQNNNYIAGNCAGLVQSGNVFNETMGVMMPGFPAHLINFVTPEELLKLRGK